MRLEIELAGDVQVSRKLLRFADNVEDASPAFQAIARQIQTAEKYQFDSNGRHTRGWKKLAPSTVARKLASEDPRIRENANVVLRATGDTERSLTGDGEGHVEIVQPHQLTYGTTVPQALFHQPDPQDRRVLEFRGRDKADMVRTLQSFLVGTIDGATARGLT